MLSSSLTQGGTERMFKLAAAVFFVIFAGVLYLPYLTHLPEGIHTWAQADRLSLALSYYDRGMQFLRPRTYNLSSIDGVVGVEFPIIPYLAALFGKVFGRGTVVPAFRGITIGLSVLACYYLFRMVFERTGSFVAGLVPGIFLLTSPVYAFYSGNFLPDAPGAALSLVAYYYFLRYYQQPRFRDLALGLVLFTLATLIKTSAGVYLLAAYGVTLILSYFRNSLFTTRQKVWFLLLMGLSFGAVLGYIFLNKWLNTTFDSTMFLAEPRPLTTTEEANKTYEEVMRTWWNEYFTQVHYWVLAACWLYTFVGALWNQRREPMLATQVWVSLLGALAFLWLMGRQFGAHDYYILSPFMPLLLLVLVQTLVRVATLPLPRLAVPTALGVLAAALLIIGTVRHRARMSDDYPPFSDFYDYRWMRGGAQLLNQAQVPADATVLVANETAPNIGLVYFDRRGLAAERFILQTEPSEVVRFMAERGLDYFIMRRKDSDELRAAHSTLFSVLEPVTESADVTVLRRRGRASAWH
ncbi:glycosyltransferase family 39 protein [Hymenobacter sp. 15J16-1T3B]|uniref:glycosyltransferase family 39 protein n=1 Tax=Hymenobacter sp. 15J16-1T3B TaxID=2886941 RepID=UPI001D0FBADC|nr:glycosyltransferase family 39 protein [Hymenobacter sp. 15J16-1T3B]MCC3155934.1 glycosyltransferase family 39 protein [Hymenobacter sp. 15J16-1T3B]